MSIPSIDRSLTKMPHQFEVIILNCVIRLALMTHVLVNLMAFVTKRKEISDDISDVSD